MKIIGIVLLILGLLVSLAACTYKTVTPEVSTAVSSTTAQTAMSQNIQPQSATSIPSITAAGTASHDPINSPESENKKQPYIRGTNFKITQDDLVKINSNLTEDLTKLIVKNKNGEATFVLSMTPKDMVNEYCKIDPSLAKDKNKYINAFENDPIDESEEPPYLGTENAATALILYNRKVGHILAALNTDLYNETNKLGPITLETSTPQDIINLLGNPQQIGTGPLSKPFMVYNLDKGEKVLNLRFLFEGNVAGQIEMYIYNKAEFLHWLQDNSGGLHPDP
jgi:hypothetical protein